MRLTGAGDHPCCKGIYDNATDLKDFISKVRGVKVSYSAAAINAYYELPIIENDVYSLCESNLDPKAVLRVIESQGAQWRFNENQLLLKLESKYMDYQMKVAQIYGSKIDAHQAFCNN